MACGCFPDVRGQLDAALFDLDDLRQAIADLSDHADIEVLDDQTPLPFKADIEAAIAAGRLTRVDSSGPGSVAVYLDEDRKIIHFGLIGEGDKVTSRWAGGLICRHGLFDLPRSHGEMAHFYAPAGPG
jgi:hypothetical protein